MKAITVKQPWAWGIAHADKTIENRTALWKYRGPLAIHAGSGWSTRGAADRRIIGAILAQRFTQDWTDLVWTTNADGAPALHSASLLTRGAIIAISELVDVHPATGSCCEPWGESSYLESGGKLRTEVTHLVLEDVKPLAIGLPLVMPGRLGLWDVPEDAQADIRGQLAA